MLSMHPAHFGKQVGRKETFIRGRVDLQLRRARERPIMYRPMRTDRRGEESGDQQQAAGGLETGHGL
jgi:hypothetical protein